MPIFICDYCGNLENTARTYWFWVHRIPLCTCCVSGDKWEHHKDLITDDIKIADLKTRKWIS